MASSMVIARVACLLLLQINRAYQEVWETNSTGPLDVVSPGRFVPAFGDTENEVLGKLFSMFMKLHESSGEMSTLHTDAEAKSEQNDSRTTSTEGTTTTTVADSRTDITDTSVTVSEFGAPLPTQQPQSQPSDLTVLISVLITTAVVFFCFIFLLLMQCCAEVVCIDLLYCCSKCFGWKQRRHHHHSHRRRNSDEVVVIKLLPNSPSLQQLLSDRSAASGRYAIRSARQHKKPYARSI